MPHNSPQQLQGRIDGIYRQTVRVVRDTWKNHPFRIPILMLVVLITTTASLNLLYVPTSPSPTKVGSAKANSHQFTPTAGNLVTGTAQNANSLLAAAAEGVNTGSWRGTLSDDNLHWQVTALDAGTPNLNLQIDLGTARLANANKLLIQTEVDLDSASRLLKVQICDWVSSTGVDAVADAQCTTGGWRSLNTQTTGNADVDIGLTTGAAFQWHLFDGYFSTGTTGGTAVSTPLTNFTGSDTQPLRVRFWSDSDVVGTGDVAIDFVRAMAFVDSVYHPAGAVNLNGSGGALAGTYANAHVIGNTATAQQSLTAGDNAYLTGAGTAGSLPEYRLVFENVKTYTGANSFYFKAEYSCGANTVGLDHKFSLYNFTTTTWTDFNSAVIACNTTDATNGWAISNVTPSDYIDEAAGDEVWVRFQGDLNSTTTLRIDFAYLMIGSVNDDSAQCEVTWGTGTATDCVNTRSLNTPAGTSYFNNTAEDRSTAADNDYYPTDCVANATATEECSASNISMPVTVPADGLVAVNHFVSRHRAQLNSTNPDLIVTAGIRDYSGTPTSTAASGGWSSIGAASTAGAFAYTDSVMAMTISAYGNMTNPEDHVDTVNNRMNMRLRTSTNGTEAVNNIVEWDFAFVSIGWVVDSTHATRNYQFTPTGLTLSAGNNSTRNAELAATAEGINTGSWRGMLGDDNLHGMFTGANVVGTNYNIQANFATARLNGANKILIQTEFDTDAALTLKFQICDWVSSTSVDTAADSDCTTGGWRTLNSQNASNVDVDFTASTTNGVTLQWHIFDGYFTTGTTGGAAISTPLTNFIHATNGFKFRFFSTTQSATDLAIDFVRIQPIIDSIYHPTGATNLNGGGGALAGTYANAHVIGNSATGQQATTTADAVYLTGAGTASTIADYYLSFTNIKTYAGANTVYFKADYSCSATTAGLDHKFALYNFTTAAWVDFNATAIACNTTDATHAWAVNNVTLSDYLNGGEARVRFYGDLNSTTTLRIDYAYLMIGSTNSDTADCQVSFGTGTASNCSNTRNLDGSGTASRFDNPAEDESATMGTGDSNSYHAFDNETTPDTTVEESTSSNISFPVTEPNFAATVGINYAGRFSGCGNTGAACGAATLTVQLGLKDYSGLTTTGGWQQVGGTSASSALAYTDSVTALGIASYGWQSNPEDYIDTASGKINMRLRTTTPGTSTSNVTTVWDFAMVSLQWIEIGNTIDISGSSSVTGATVAVAVDGLLQSGKTATTSGTCPCAWTITSVFVAGDRPVLVWLDGASDANESSGLTVYGGSGNITGLQLTANTLSVGSADNQTTDSADLIKFDNDADEDVMFRFSSSTLTVDATSAYSAEILDITSGDTLSVDGSETVTTHDLAINGTLTSGGNSTYTVNGTWTNTGTFNESTSTVTLAGTTSQNLNSGCSNTDTCTAQNFYNLTVNKTDANTANDNVTLTTNGVRVSNTLTITDGELVQGALNVRVEGSSAVSIAAAGTWTNISTGDLKLGGTFVNNGVATFNSNNGTQCVDAADDIVITSTSGGSQRAWSGSGTFTLYNLSVTDMTDSSITAYTSSFSNTTWTLGSCGVDISGTCNQYDQTTDCTDDGSNQIRVAVNGTLRAQVDTTVDGAWTLSAVSVSNGDVVTVFIDGAADNEEAVAVTKYDGTGNITGVTLFWRHLTIGSADNQTLSNTNLSQYDNSVSADEDIFFDVSAGDDLTVDSLASYTDEEFYVVSGNTYRPASGGGADMTTVHVENDGTITADSNTFTISGNWQNDGTFNSNTSTITFNSTSTGRTLSGAMTGSNKFNAIVFDGSGGGWTLGAAIESTGNFTVTTGTLTTSGSNYAVTVGGNYTMGASGNVTGNGSTFTVAGDWTQSNSSWNTNGTGSDTTTVILTGTSKNLTTTGSLFSDRHFYNFTLQGTYTHASGIRQNVMNNTDIQLGSTLTFVGNSQLHHFGGSATSATIAGTITGSSTGIFFIRNILTTITITGTVSVQSFSYLLNTSGTIPALSYGNTVLALQGETNDVTFTLGAGTFTICGLTIQHGTTARTLTVEGSTNNPTINAHSNAGCYVNFPSANGSTILNLGSINLTVSGSWTNTDGATINPGTSTVSFTSVASRTITSASQAFYNMTFNGVGGTWALQDAAVANNNLTITNGTFNANGQSLTIGNNYSNAGTFTAGSGTVTFNATDAGNTLGGTMTGSSAFNNIVFNGVGGTWALGANIAANGNLDVTNGTLDTSGSNYSVTVTGNFTMASGGNVTGNASTFTISGNWDQANTSWNTAGTGSGTTTVILNGTSKTLDTTGTNSTDRHFYNLTINGSYTKGTGDRLNVYNNFILNTSSSLSGIEFSPGGLHIWSGSATVTINGSLSPSTGSMFIRTSMPTITSSVGIGVRVDYYMATVGTHTIPALDYNAGLLINGQENNTVRLGSGTFNIGSTAGSFTMENSVSGKTTTVDNATNNATVNVTNNVLFPSNVGSITAQLGSANYSIGGSWTNTDGATVTPGTSTVTFNSAGARTITSAAQSFGNVTVTGGGTLTLQDAAATTGNLTISAGTLDVNNSGNYSLTIGGNYSNSGTFTARNGTVTFNATDTGNTLGGTMTGSSAFNNLTFNGSGGEWTPSAAITVTNDLTMTAGTLLGTQDIVVNGNVAGTSGVINLSGGTFEQPISASNKNFGTTSGGATWTFNNITFSSSFVGPCVSSSHTTQTGGTGGINVTGILRIGKTGEIGTCGTDLSAGNRTWTLSGTGGDPFQILTSPAGNLTPSTSTFIYTGDNTGGFTTIQSETYNHLAVNNAAERYVLEANTATGEGGNLTITAGTFDLNSNPFGMSIGGSYTNNGDFDSRTGTVTFTSTTTGRTLSGQMTGANDDFYDLVFNGVGGGWTFDAAVAAANDVTVTNGAVTANNNNLTATRDFVLANTTGVTYTAGSSTISISRHFTDIGDKFIHDTSTITMAGAGTFTTANNSQFYNVQLGPSGFTTTLSLNDWDVNNLLTFNGGTVNGGGGSWIDLNCSTSCAPVSFTSPTSLTSARDLIYRSNSGSITVTIAGGNYGSWGIVGYAATGNNSTWQLGGNITSTSIAPRIEAADSVNGSIFTTTASNYSISSSAMQIAPCTPTRSGSWTVHLNDSSVTLSSTGNSLSVGNNCGSHTLNLNTSDVIVNGSVKFSQGTGALTVNPGTSDFTFAPTASQTETFAPNGQSLWNMTVNGANSTATIQPTAATDVNNNFTITAGTYDTVSGSNYALTVGGNFTNNGTLTAQNATVTLDGTATQSVNGTLTGSSSLYNFTVSNSSGASASDCERTGFTPSVDFNVDVTVSNNLTFTTANTRIEFDDGNTYTFTNINWNGQAAGTRIFFRSSATSGTWLLKVTGTQTAVSYVNVSRSDASVAGGSTISAIDGTNVDCTNNTNWNFGAATFEQSAYRFANNENATTVNYGGAPAQDTPLTVLTTGEAFRLRLTVHIGSSNLAQNGKTFKLQYGEKTAANCATGVSWADVSPSSGVIRFKDNATPNDGDDLTTNGGDPGHSGHTIVAQDYEEANNFTNSVAAINVGQDGLWDFSLENNSAPGGSRYCFRAVESDGTQFTAGYSQYPEILVDEELVFSLDSTSKNFGVIQPGDNPTNQTSTVTVTTSAKNGYVVYAWATQQMTKGPHTIPAWSGTNGAPTTFGNGSFGFGYSTDDSTLTGGTADRFTSGGAKYAGFTTSGPGDPVADRSSGPVSGATGQNIITYRLAGGVGQEAGTYTTVIVYVVTPTF